MLNLLIALASGLAVTFGIRLAGFSWVAGIIPGTLAFIAVFIVLGRRILLKVQAITQEAQKELSVPSSNVKEQKVRIEKAIKLLESALVYKNWQFLLEGEMYAQIGIIKYMVKDLEGAQAAFAKANPRNPMAAGFQGAMAYQRKDTAAMQAAFERAVKHGKKEGVLWAAYAWCLQQLKESEKALTVLARAVEANPSDEKLKSAQAALQNDKKLKMKAFEPMWWQFGLEAPPMQMQPRVRFQRR
jgi:tetratricopeptide (TPR) repeat protein